MSNQLSEEQIAPCPFCGLAMKVVYVRADGRCQYIRCGSCGASGPDGNNDRPEAVASWNCRSTPSPEVPDGSSQDHAPTADAAAETRLQDIELEWTKRPSRVDSALRFKGVWIGSARNLHRWAGTPKDTPWQGSFLRESDGGWNNWFATEAEAQKAVETAACEWLSRPSPDTANPTSEPEPVAWRWPAPQLGENAHWLSEQSTTEENIVGEPLFTSPPSNKELVEAVRDYIAQREDEETTIERVSAFAGSSIAVQTARRKTAKAFDRLRAAIKTGGGL